MLSRRLLRIKVVKAMYAHLRSEDESIATALKALKAGVDGAYNLYLQVLTLPAEVARLAEERAEIARHKKLATFQDLNPNMRFIENPVIQAVSGAKSLWSSEVVKHLYGELVESPYYIRYMEGKTSDAQVLESFFVETVQDDAMVEKFVEEQSVLWADDLDFALSVAVKTVARGRVLPQYKSDDDARFAPELMRHALEDFSASLEIAAGLIENWDMERVAFMDTIILAAAIAEMRHFPSIPVKVTLDEYIEIAKYYSTPQSGVFINGVLDKAAKTVINDQ